MSTPRDPRSTGGWSRCRLPETLAGLGGESMPTPRDPRSTGGGVDVDSPRPSLDWGWSRCRLPETLARLGSSRCTTPRPSFDWDGVDAISGKPSLERGSGVDESQPSDPATP